MRWIVRSQNSKPEIRIDLKERGEMSESIEGRRDPQAGKNARLNWLRAAVLGANDGIVSVAGIVLGVAGATSEKNTIFTAGLAGLVAGALSMAAGEYISVSSQRDAEQKYVDQERKLLKDFP